MITTTELIKLLQDNELGGISHKPRKISLTVNGRYLPEPQITISSTGDGICGPEIDLDVDGEWLEPDQVSETDLDIDEEIKKFESNAEFERTHENLRGCQEFKKLAEWLRELKAYKEQELCEDAISREAALEAILTSVPDFCGGDEGGNLIGRNETASYIRNLPSVTPKQKWIPVNERPPEEGKTVMASTNYGVYPEARYSKKYGWEWPWEAGADYWAEIVDSVEAWMELPKPYKAGSENEA